MARILVEAHNCHTDQDFLDVVNFLISYLDNGRDKRNRMRLLKQIGLKIKQTARATHHKSLEQMILTGFSDRIGRSRGEKYFEIITKQGDTLKINKESCTHFDPRHYLWIVLDINHKNEVTKIIPIEEEWLYDLTPFPLSEEISYLWDEKKQSVMKVERLMLGKIILSEAKLVPQISNEVIVNILTEEALKFLNNLHQSQEYERLMVLKNLTTAKVTMIDPKEILCPFFQGQVSISDEVKNNISAYYFSSLKSRIDPENIYDLEKDFPLNFKLSDKRLIPIHYEKSMDPWLESYIQDFYGLTETPKLAKGNIKLTLKLLGPHKRALQVTQDLRSFWIKTYPSMLKELARDYPRHYWPTDPATAKPFLLKRHLP